jgi:hypothetical protein
MKWFAALIGAGLVVVGFCGMIIARHDGSRITDSEVAHSKESDELPVVRGIVLDAAALGVHVDAAAQQSRMEQIAALGANWIELPVELNGSSDVDVAALTGLVDAAHKQAINVCVECRLAAAARAALPAHDAGQSGWVSEVWGPRVLRLAKAAAAADVDLLCLGERLDGVQEREAAWRGLIGQIHKVYKRSLTYAADSQSYCYVQWWDQLDYIGVVGNFPLSNKPDPRLNSTMCAFNAQLESLKTLNWHLYKPVLVLDVGYSANPWVAYDPNLKDDALPPRLDIQTTCYQTALECTKGKGWLAGVFLKTWAVGAAPAEDELHGAGLQKLLKAQWHASPKPVKP